MIKYRKVKNDLLQKWRKQEKEDRVEIGKSENRRDEGI